MFEVETSGELALVVLAFAGMLAGLALTAIAVLLGYVVRQWRR